MKEKENPLLLANQVCFPLYAASRLTTKLYTPLLKKLDITYPQYLVLLVLWEHDRLTVGEISERLYLETNTLTPLLKRMEQKQLIQKQRDSGDERTVIVSLTARGKKCRQEALCIPASIVGSLSKGPVNKKQVKQFRDMLNALLDNLQQQTAGINGQ